MSQRGQRIEVQCPTCLTSGKRGWLPLGKDDWVECPDCGATGTFVMYERLVVPPVFFLPVASTFTGRK